MLIRFFFFIRFPFSSRSFSHSAVLCLFTALHLYYSHAIYRIKYSNLTFTIRFKACYFYVFTFVVVCLTTVKLCNILGRTHTPKKKVCMPTTTRWQQAVRKLCVFFFHQLYLECCNLYEKAIEIARTVANWLAGGSLLFRLFFVCLYVCVSLCAKRRIFARLTQTTYKLKNMYY